MDVAERDRRYVAREEPPDGVQVARSDGCFVFDHHGRKYIDFTAGWCVGNLGWGNDEVRAAIRAFDGPAYVHPDHLYRPWAELAETLAGIVPVKRAKCYRATGGSEAVEIALQVAMAATGRPGFVALEDCYHGNTLGPQSLAGDRDKYPNLLAHCHRVGPPLDDRAAGRVERLLRGGTVAAFVMEPVVCNLGVLIPSKEFMTEVRAACRETNTLFVADEVATGFGRTGKLFASEHFDLDPDVMCLAKAITAGYAPMGATVATGDVAKAAGVGFYSTYGWHPLSVAAALANLRFWGRHKVRILANVDDQGEYFRSRLSGMKFAEPASVRVMGLAIGVEFGGGSDYAAKLGDRCREAGLLVSTEEDNLLTMYPPLTIDREVARHGLDLLEGCLMRLRSKVLPANDDGSGRSRSICQLRSATPCRSPALLGRNDQGTRRAGYTGPALAHALLKSLPIFRAPRRTNGCSGRSFSHFGRDFAVTCALIFAHHRKPKSLQIMALKRLR